MKLTPYLFFDSTCRQAFEFYAATLSGRIVMMMTAGDSPMADKMPPEARDRIMHVRLEAEDNVLMGSDGMMGEPELPTGFRVCIEIGEPAEADRIFGAFAEGGTIDMPIQQTFWARRFGMVKDRFGTPWMISCA
jgi:PhnB protein